MNWSVLSLSLLSGCVRCQPDLPETGDSASPDTDSGTNPDVDTAAPRCQHPEAEPNDAPDQAEGLAIEALGCGVIDPVLDVDRWGFSVAQPAWLAVEVRASSIGSLADVAVVLTRGDGDVAEAHRRADGEQDIAMLFPAAVGTYDALILDENFLGGSDAYFYEVLISEAKAPVVATVDSLDVHDASQAQPLGDGDLVLGTLATTAESDWYSLPIPAGTASVALTVEAALWGSPADLQLQVVDAAGDLLYTVVSDGQGGPDPVAELATAGDTTWRVRVSEQSARGGDAYWYALRVEHKGVR